MIKLKKILSLIKKKYYLFFIFLIVVICNNFCSTLTLDEIWNYGFANNLYRGLIPYKDFNMVITPLYPFVISLFFYIFGSNNIVIVIFNALIVTLTFYYIKKFIGNKYCIILFFMLVPYCMVFPNYNILLFLFLVLLIYLEEKEEKNNYLIGVLLGFAFLTKQNVGLFLLLPSFYYIKNKNYIIKRFIGFLIPIIIFLLYLIINKSLYEFLDLCLFGLFDFADKNFNFNLLIIPFIIMFLLTLYYIFNDKRNIRYYYILAFYSIVIPIIDYSHVSLAFWSFLIILIDKVNIKINFNYNLFCYSVIVAVNLFSLRDKIANEDVIYPNKVNHFEYRLINKKNLDHLMDINQYIGENANKKVVFLDGNGYLFRIINDEDCSYLDLINQGNWGYNGSEKLIDTIKKQTNSIYLVDENEFKNKNQIDLNSVKYIINNYKKIGNISQYDIYVSN